MICPDSEVHTASMFSMRRRGELIASLEWKRSAEPHRAAATQLRLAQSDRRWATCMRAFCRLVASCAWTRSRTTWPPAFTRRRSVASRRWWRQCMLREPAPNSAMPAASSRLKSSICPFSGSCIWLASPVGRQQHSRHAHEAAQVAGLSSAAAP